MVDGEDFEAEDQELDNTTENTTEEQPQETTTEAEEAKATPVYREGHEA